MFVAVFALVLGLGGVAVAILQLRNLTALRSWRTTPGRVVERGTFVITHATPSPPGHQHAPLVRYAYQVDGQDLTNDAILPRHVQLPRHSTIEWAQQQSLAFPEDVTVHYDPANPASSYVEPVPASRPYLVLALSSLIALGAVLVLVL